MTVLLSHGFLAYLPTDDECMLMAHPIIKTLALAELVVIGDNDPDPRVREEQHKVTEHRAEELSGKLFFPPDEYKDMDKWKLENMGQLTCVATTFNVSASIGPVDKFYLLDESVVFLFRR